LAFRRRGEDQRALALRLTLRSDHKGVDGALEPHVTAVHQLDLERRLRILDLEASGAGDALRFFLLLRRRRLLQHRQLSTGASCPPSSCDTAARLRWPASGRPSPAAIIAGFRSIATLRRGPPRPPTLVVAIGSLVQRPSKAARPGAKPGLAEHGGVGAINIRT